MKYFAVGYHVAEGVFSVNTVTANTGRNELEAVTETAQRRAARHGYEIGFIREITEAEASEARRKCRPTYPIDAEAAPKT